MTDRMIAPSTAALAAAAVALLAYALLRYAGVLYAPPISMLAGIGVFAAFMRIAEDD